MTYTPNHGTGLIASDDGFRLLLTYEPGRNVTQAEYAAKMERVAGALNGAPAWQPIETDGNPRGMSAVFAAAAKLNADITGLSWSGFGIAGDDKSISEVRRLMNFEERVLAERRIAKENT